MATERPVLTLRFHNQATRDLLGFVAEYRHTSMNAVAEAALETQLRQDAAVIEQELTTTLAQLRRYDIDTRLEADAERFARSEVEDHDPLRSTRADAALDPLGLTSPFV